MKKAKHILLGFITVVSLAACSTISKPLPLNNSYLAKNKSKKQVVAEQVVAKNQTQNVESGLVYLPALNSSDIQQSQQVSIDSHFSENEMVQLTADSLKVKDYLHYVFGELLSVNYILGDEIADSDDAITINLKDKLSKRKLFNLSQELLDKRGIIIREKGDIFYIHSSGNSAGSNLTYGYGNQVKDIPIAGGEILQIAPFNNGMQTSLAHSIKQLTGVEATPLFEQNAIMFKGKRNDIVRAIEFMQVMDSPAFRNRHIAIYKSEFVPANELSKKLTEVLKQEGISSSTTGTTEKAISIVNIERTNSLIFFTNNKSFLNRLQFWASHIDQPADGTEKQYFIFEPEFARAIDLGESLQNLISGGSALTNRTSASSEDKKANNATEKSISASSEHLRMVVDERSNALIFHTSGTEYRNMLPLIKRLDVMPKQVVLEVLIAEVTLTDEFSQGVEFALSNNRALQTGYHSFSGGSKTGLSYVLEGVTGKLDISLFEKNQNVDVLSKPTIAVRDGVEANITVGNEIPTVGEIVSDPTNGNRTSVVYRKTGIMLNVTPTVNAQGVILMEIEQEISNDASGDDAVEGQPTIFKRSIKTEVIAADGQTVMLGGLISENKNLTNTGVPVFSDIPILGRLFDGRKDTTEKTELIVMVTPRVIDSAEQWDSVINVFKENLSNLNFND
ncbi:Type II secretory pathway component PulD-like protein [Pseudoalteromonas sp. MMG013]|uniref:type II secretion system protein GspD n=1 Tax=Pseudoalteromonas sp. MMG013 TaxID=2822687 RepID=UPI001B3705E9|nr:secretin N-terminal domain-containing protein [Pseudoalteromonas sp. MMG013]MBQ4860838.1 Type II secretory pathway component PulD-like protein [Pseudoalteromonas sp. MMG013]